MCTLVTPTAPLHVCYAVTSMFLQCVSMCLQDYIDASYCIMICTVISIPASPDTGHKSSAQISIQHKVLVSTLLTLYTKPSSCKINVIACTHFFTYMHERLIFCTFVITH